MEASPLCFIMNTVRVGKIGPVPMPGDGTGTITCYQHKQILDETGCSASVRQRPAWGKRMYTISGPIAGLQQADDMARICIVGSQPIPENLRNEQPPPCVQRMVEEPPPCVQRAPRSLPLQAPPRQCNNTNAWPGDHFQDMPAQQASSSDSWQYGFAPQVFTQQQVAVPTMMAQQQLFQQQMLHQQQQQQQQQQQ